MLKKSFCLSKYFFSSKISDLKNLTKDIRQIFDKIYLLKHSLKIDIFRNIVNYKDQGNFNLIAYGHLSFTSEDKYLSITTLQKILIYP